MSESTVEPREPGSSEPSEAEQREQELTETAHERARLLEQMIEDDRTEAVWDFFHQLHPYDRADVMTELRGGLRRFLAQEMAPETVAGLLEHLDPRISARMLRGYMPADLAGVLDLADPGPRPRCWSRCPMTRELQPYTPWRRPLRWKPCCATRTAQRAGS